MADDGEAKTAKPELTLEELVRVAELGFEGFKWFEAQGTEAIKVAARTLWLSNAGGLALVVGFLINNAENLPPTAAGGLIASAVAFIVGIYLGAISHVRPAHNVTKYQVELFYKFLDLTKKKKSSDQILSEIVNMIPKKEETTVVVTQYLVWAEKCLAAGAALGVIATLMFFFA